MKNGGKNMKIERLKKDQVLGNKINGKCYQVLEVENENGVIAGTAAEVDADYEVIDPNVVVKVTADNDRCFRILQDVEPEILEGYSAKDGILMKDDSAVTQQGELYIKDVVGAAKGEVLLLVKGRDVDGDDLFTYSPEKDSFKKVYRGMGDIIITSNIPDASATVIGWNKYRAEKRYDEKTGEIVTDENGNPVEEMVFLYSILMSYSEDGIINACENNVEIGAIVGTYKLKNELVDIVIECCEKEDVCNMHFAIGNSGITCWRNDKKFGKLLGENPVYFVPEYADGGVLMRFHDHIVYDNYHGNKQESVIKMSDIGSKTDGFDYLVDRYWDRDKRLVYVLGNKDGQTLSVVSDKTKDRGYVVTIEK